VNTPPTSSGRAGVIVTLHSPAVEENSTGPSVPATVNDSTLSALVAARLTNDVPERWSALWPLVQVMSIGAGGGAQTAGVRMPGKLTFIARSPEIVRVAPPTSSGLSGPGETDVLGDTVSVGDSPPDDGGEIDGDGPWPIPVAVHAIEIQPKRTPRRAPSARVRRRIPRIPPSLPHASRRTRTYPLVVTGAARDRAPGFVPAIIAAGVSFATAAVYLAVIVSQDSHDIVGSIVIAAWIVGLGVAALVGATRPSPDRVIPLGAATGGLVGAAIVSLFSIGLLLLVGGVFALVAWTRAGVGASSRDQLFGGLAGVVAAMAFLLLVIMF
jgi:hypothetical protein